jgi:hypothetical protein
MEWFTSQLPMLRPTFEPYMKFEEWHPIPWRRLRSWRPWERWRD